MHNGSFIVWMLERIFPPPEAVEVRRQGGGPRFNDTFLVPTRIILKDDEENVHGQGLGRKVIQLGHNNHRFDSTLNRWWEFMVIGSTPYWGMRPLKHC